MVCIQNILTWKRRTWQIISQNLFWLSFCDFKELSVQTVYPNAHSHKYHWLFSFFFYVLEEEAKINRENVKQTFFSASENVNNFCAYFRFIHIAVNKINFLKIRNTILALFLHFWNIFFWEFDTFFACHLLSCSCFMAFFVDKCDI